MRVWRGGREGEREREGGREREVGREACICQDVKVNSLRPALWFRRAIEAYKGVLC